ICVITGLRPVSNALIRLFFHNAVPNHIHRLAARLTAMALLFAIPGWFMIRHVNLMPEDLTPLLEPERLGGGLLGYVFLALAAVGFLVRRSPRATLERLGLRTLTGRHVVVIAVGVVALFALNGGAEWIQRTHFPALWESDRAATEAIARNLTVFQGLVLGLSAGIGEEITLRGALQPRLGIVMTALLFASLHVQYSWFGILVIFLLGIFLGWMRRWTSTTVAIVIHTLYDMIAVFAVMPQRG
ncbi:MAG: CPBP family intramembrane glutamic endopeptidase, partial [bacterium]